MPIPSRRSRFLQRRMPVFFDLLRLFDVLFVQRTQIKRLESHFTAVEHRQLQLEALQPGIFVAIWAVMVFRNDLAIAVPAGPTQDLFVRRLALGNLDQRHGLARSRETDLFGIFYVREGGKLRRKVVLQVAIEAPIDHQRHLIAGMSLEPGLADQNDVAPRRVLSSALTKAGNIADINKNVRHLVLTPSSRPKPARPQSTFDSKSGLKRTAPSMPGADVVALGALEDGVVGGDEVIYSRCPRPATGYLMALISSSEPTVPRIGGLLSCMGRPEPPRRT